MEFLDPNNIKQESLSDDEIDDNAYYVVIINEENGEKVVKAVKIESTDDVESITKSIKKESNDMKLGKDEEITEVTEEETEDLNKKSTENESNSILCEAILADNEDNNETIDQSRLNLIQVLSGNDDADPNIMTYDDGMSLVGEVITGDLNVEDGATYTQEVLVGDVDGEYHIITADGEIALIGDDEETITVMQQEDGSFLCECGEAYMDFGDYENHIKVHNTFICNVCERGFESNEILEGHLLLHKSNDFLLSCPFCSQNVKRGMLTTHIKLHHSHVKNFCTLCKKTFASEANLKRHMQVHDKFRKFECNICFKRFTQKNLMENHRLTHENASLKCALCAQEFGSEDECIQHQKEGCILPPSEGREKPHVCDVCGKSYATPNSLKAHMDNTHNGQNMEILCSECGEVLPSRKAMYTHSFQHRQGRRKNVNRFSCETCGKGCASHAMLLMHERVHTNERPYQCSKCPLAFKTKTHLTTHQLTHTQEKRFGCSVCMKFFALKGNLVVHLRTHTGERPYVCSICSQGFIDSKYLKKHKQKRHDIANIPWNEYY